MLSRIRFILAFMYIMLLQPSLMVATIGTCGCMFILAFNFAMADIVGLFGVDYYPFSGYPWPLPSICLIFAIMLVKASEKLIDSVIGENEN